ncbi:MAG TPA: hypothetical protein VMW72_13420 [Sedimentisphaerales bacterium]|nr:hypothetical protein [Sedimentisphaerales bacterium]
MDEDPTIAGWIVNVRNLVGLVISVGIGKAKDYWEKSVRLYKRIGMPQMVEKVQGWITGGPMGLPGIPELESK